MSVQINKEIGRHKKKAVQIKMEYYKIFDRTQRRITGGKVYEGTGKDIQSGGY